MPQVMLKDRNGPSKVAEQKENINKTFSDLSAKLLDINKQIQNSQGAASIKTVTPAHKMSLFNSFYHVSNTHSSVALEFMNKLETWAHESLVPQYKESIDEALQTGEEDIIFQAVSRSVTCFSLFARVTSTIFHNVAYQLAEPINTPRIVAPKQILFGAFRDEFYNRVQGTFFRRLAAIRRSEDLTQLRELKPIADIFFAVARSTEFITPHHLSLRKRLACAGPTLPYAIEGYIRQMVTDNKAAVKEQMTRGVPANEIAGWINRRASFEQHLMSSLVAPENNLQRAILDRYNDEVVAECTTALVLDEKAGFAASFRNGDKTVESFTAAIELFHISFRVEKSHPKYVALCVAEFRKGVPGRLRKLINESRQPVYDNPNGHADAFIKSLIEEFHILEKAINKMNNHHDLQRANNEPFKAMNKMNNYYDLQRAKNDSFKAILNSDKDEERIVRKCKRGSNIDEKKLAFPEVLAVFVDSFLKSDENNAIDQTSETVSDIGVLFSFVEDKDIFGQHYKLRLSKRLLQFKYNEDLELQVLEQMQKQSGKHFIHKFEGMINDVRVAESIQTKFEEAKVQGLPCAFTIKVLTFAYWPQIKPDDSFVSPDSLRQCQDGFERYYRRFNPTKQLKWQAERGSAVLDIAFPKGTKEVNMNIHQAAVMIQIDSGALLPNGGSSTQTVSAISNATGIEIAEIKPLIASMMLAKGLNLVRVHGKGIDPKFDQNSCIEMNPDFSIRVRKLKLPSAVTARATASETVQDETIDASRGQMLDAAIVRIMKSRKQMRQQDLVENTIQACIRFFKPQPRHIKLRIEELMSKEFLERDEHESDLYRYLA